MAGDPQYLHQSKLVARITELERALKPFAKEADAWAETVPNGYRPGITEPRQRQFHARAEFNLGHLRRAKRLLSDQPST